MTREGWAAKIRNPKSEIRNKFKIPGGIFETGWPGWKSTIKAPAPGRKSAARQVEAILASFQKGRSETRNSEGKRSLPDWPEGWFLEVFGGYSAVVERYGSAWSERRAAKRGKGVEPQPSGTPTECWVLLPPTGGIASLNPRLHSGNPAGCFFVKPFGPLQRRGAGGWAADLVVDTGG